MWHSLVAPKRRASDETLNELEAKGLDAIIIGSGMGGLTCAATLAKAGKRVLVLEQHYVAGGCTHTFEHRYTNSHSLWNPPAI